MTRAHTGGLAHAQLHDAALTRDPCPEGSVAAASAGALCKGTRPACWHFRPFRACAYRYPGSRAAAPCPFFFAVCFLCAGGTGRSLCSPLSGYATLGPTPGKGKTAAVTDCLSLGAPRTPTTTGPRHLGCTLALGALIIPRCAHTASMKEVPRTYVQEFRTWLGRPLRRRSREVLIFSFHSCLLRCLPPT